jgi:fumarylacetoacetase
MTLWVASADGHQDFPLANLPHGVFAPPGAAPRGGIAIGDMILDVAAAISAGRLHGPDAEAAAQPTLNAFFAMGAAARQSLRAQVTELLTGPPAPELLHNAADCAMKLPCAIGDYTDFYAGIQHALNVGRLLRPDAPLMPNYKYLPVGYHGRASSVRPSGLPVRRPKGQRKPASETVPSFGPSRNLDYELEMGVWIGPGNELGTTIPISEAASHIAGFCLLNDWSARDIQGWEYQPLGPFLAKSFQTTISPWVVTPEALAPFRLPQTPRDAEDPAILPHLLDEADQAHGALDVTLEVLIQTQSMTTPHRLSRGHAGHLYWTPAQMVAHHASAGCDLRPGDLFGTGTISSPEPEGWGSLLELSRGGRTPIQLPNGETRRFLEDGDTIILRARAERDGLSIGFGACHATVAPAS